MPMIIQRTIAVCYLDRHGDPERNPNFERPITLEEMLDALQTMSYMMIINCYGVYDEPVIWWQRIVRTDPIYSRHELRTLQASKRWHSVKYRIEQHRDERWYCEALGFKAVDIATAVKYVEEALIAEEKR